MQVYVNFVTGCGCSRMEVAVPDWAAPASIVMPVVFPPKAFDWVNTQTDAMMEPPKLKERKFVLSSEELMKDGQMKIYVYRESE
jgi:hypothetical protein